MQLGSLSVPVDPVATHPAVNTSAASFRRLQVGVSDSVVQLEEPGLTDQSGSIGTSWSHTFVSASWQAGSVLDVQ